MRRGQKIHLTSTWADSCDSTEVRMHMGLDTCSGEPGMGPVHVRLLGRDFHQVLTVPSGDVVSGDVVAREISKRRLEAEQHLFQEINWFLV